MISINFVPGFVGIYPPGQIKPGVFFQSDMDFTLSVIIMFFYLSTVWDL